MEMYVPPEELAAFAEAAAAQIRIAGAVRGRREAADVGRSLAVLTRAAERCRAHPAPEGPSGGGALAAGQPVPGPAGGL